MIKNPNFHLDESELDAEQARMAGDPRPLARPVVILGGWHSPGVANLSVASKIRPHTSGRAEDFLSITYPFKLSIRAAANAAVAALRQGGLWGKQVDLIGVSMGGVLARALASGHFGHEAVPAARIFTIATPHRGAKIARAVILDSCAWDLRPSSRFIAQLNSSKGLRSELVCYGALRDWWIGAPNTAPPGMHPLWIDVPSALGRLCSHFAINHDRRVLLDIARRLRGEDPIAKAATPPPCD